MATFDDIHDIDLDNGIDDIPWNLKFLKTEIQKNVCVPDATRVHKPVMPQSKPIGKSEISSEFLWEKEWGAPWEKYLYKAGRELTYLSMYRKLSNDDYNKLFSWFVDVRQWYFGDCYLVSAIKTLARSRYFDSLMITSIQKNNDGSYDLYLPLWRPNWRKIHISPDELKIAKIKWSDGYKILEVWYAKAALLKKNWSMLYTWEMPDIKLTEEAMNNIIWGNSFSAITTFLGESELKWQIISNKPENHSAIIQKLKKFDPKNLRFIFISSSSRPKNIPHTKKTYTVCGQKMYYHHAYSLYSVEKIGDTIESVTLEDPANNKQKIKLSLFWFLTAFSQMTACSPKKWLLSTI